MGTIGRRGIAVEPIELLLDREAGDVLDAAARVEVEPALIGRVAAVAHSHVDERRRIANGWRREHELTRQAEDRNVAAGAERDRERRGDEQHRLAEECAERVAQIAREILDDGDAARVA